MADIELVIKIPKDTYRRIKGLVSCDYFEHDICGYCMGRIADGIPLPKGHGKLCDLDIILNKAKKHRESYMEAENSSYCRGRLHAYESYVEEVENAPTIIEADKGE